MKKEPSTRPLLQPLTAADCEHILGLARRDSADLPQLCARRSRHETTAHYAAAACLVALSMLVSDNLLAQTRPAVDRQIVTSGLSSDTEIIDTISNMLAQS